MGGTELNIILFFARHDVICDLLHTVQTHAKMKSICEIIVAKHVSYVSSD